MVQFFVEFFYDTPCASSRRASADTHLSVASFLKGLGPLDLATVLAGATLTLEDKARVVGKPESRFVGADLSVDIALDEKLQEADTLQDSDGGEAMDGNDVETGDVDV